MLANKELIAYIDYENLQKSAEECGYKSIDFARLYNWFKTKRKTGKVFSSDGDLSEMYKWMDTCNVPVTVYSPMSGRAKFRTSTRLKDLNNNGLIKLNALEPLLVHYAK